MKTYAHCIYARSGYHTLLAKTSFDEIFDLTAACSSHEVCFNFCNNVHKDRQIYVVGIYRANITIIVSRMPGRDTNNMPKGRDLSDP